MNNLDKYDSIKDRMLTGDLLLWQTHNIIGGVIQYATKSIYSHASLVQCFSEYEGIEKRRFTTESERNGVVLNLLSRRLQHQNGHVWWFPLRPEYHERRQMIGEIALSFVGVPYDFGAILRFLFGNVLTDVKAIFCSELVYISWGFSGKAPAPDQLLDLGRVGEGVQIL